MNRRRVILSLLFGFFTGLSLLSLFIMNKYIGSFAVGGWFAVVGLIISTTEEY